MKRPLRSASALAMSGALTLTGCGLVGGQTDAVPGATITLVAADYGSAGQHPSRAYWDEVIAAFQQRYPQITVKVQVFSWDTIHAKLAAMLQQGQYPDIVEGPSFSSWAQQGLLYKSYEVPTPLTTAELMPGLSDTGSLDATSFGIPFVASSRVFLINNALWRQAGLPTRDGKAVAPQTWADVEHAARQMKAAGIPVPLGLPLGPEEAQAEVLIWTINNDGGYADAAGGWDVNSPQNVATLTELRRWVDEGLTEKDPTTVDRTPLYAQFAAGKVGMLNGMPIQLADIKSHHLDVTWAPLPTAQPGQDSQALGAVDFVSAFNAGGHGQQIGAFLDFAYQRQWQLKFDEEYDLLPVTQDAADQLRTDDPSLGPFLDSLPNAQFAPADLPAWNTVQQLLKSRMRQVLDSPQQGLDAIQQAAEQGGR